MVVGWDSLGVVDTMVGIVVDVVDDVVDVDTACCCSDAAVDAAVDAAAVSPLILANSAVNLSNSFLFSSTSFAICITDIIV